MTIRSTGKPYGQYLPCFLLVTVLTDSAALAAASSKGDRSPVDIDWTLVIILIGFFLLIYFLNRLILRPILDVIEERGKRLNLPKQEAEVLRTQTAQVKAAYDQQIKAVKEKALSNREKLLQEGKAVEKKILDEIREITALEIENFKKELAFEITGLQSAVEQDAKEIAAVIVKKMLPS